MLENLSGVARHTHNGIDSPSLEISDIIKNAPQPALTPSSGSPSSGGANPLQTSDSAVISNLQTRVSELETALINLGLLN